ncbi:peptide-methionine (S)-S-oxide reductase MsrA [Nitrospina watsonii]|uniref:Peptide methionine sulfoxide reductase MsrA n=1 Tax=Nitrospina watsonii TaxID=1323948 RepID=A0ABM9HH68_9BACT|nr:peptide-methionine (S)-S-oxide reductase MsrA [Nitrospina watsonii]CAI2719705.1 Peptide methionine sulfoxide reductase MsrA [Nitrospina watsonii]
MTTTEQATFGAGCFWHVEHAFGQLRGVTATSVGYTGGHVQNPDYRMVCTGETGHAEVVRVHYDPAVVSYDELLNVFWQEHDPTSLNRQGPDVGSQYRSAIFFHTPEQEQTARAAVEKLQQSGKFKSPIVTEITAAGPYYPAEDYHQKYFDKRQRFMGANREQGY